MYMEHNSSWEVNRFSDSQEILRILWNSKVCYCLHKRSYSETNQSSSYHIPLLEDHFNITIPSMPGSVKWSLTFMFPHWNTVCTYPLPRTCYMPCPSHLITQIIYGEECRTPCYEVLYVIFFLNIYPHYRPISGLEGSRRLRLPDF